MDENYYKVIAQDTTYEIYRFPHEQEQAFLNFIIPQYNALEIIRLQDAVTVFKKDQ